MQYERKENRNPKYFKAGLHEATIHKVKLTLSKKKNEMFQIQLQGEQGEFGIYFLVFGTDYTKDALNRILSSIEDTMGDIPDMDFDYNQETANFLEGKTVYIEVVQEKYKGRLQYKVNDFLTLAEFEGNYDEDSPYDEIEDEEE